MQLTFSPDDARLVAAFLASVVVPFVTSWLKQASWPKWTRFAAAVLFSVLGGALTEYVAGTFGDGSIIAAVLAVFVASQAHYASWFRGLGFESWLMGGRV